MQITVFGASGRVGQQVVARALEEGYCVTAFVHRKNPFQDNSALTIVHGDIGDSKAVTTALQGSDAVISTLGSWGTKSKDILSRGMSVIIPAMESSGVERLITLTGSAAVWSGDKLSVVDKLNHAVLDIVAPKILRDGEDHLRQLDASSLWWTSVRSPVMTNSSSTKYRLDNKMGAPWAIIPRKAVVASLLDQLKSTEFINQAPVIH
jgi:putative NADH-flavin reductase